LKSRDRDIRAEKRHKKKQADGEVHVRAPEEASAAQVFLPADLLDFNTGPLGLCWVDVISDSMGGTLNLGDKVAVDLTDRSAHQGGVFLICDLGKTKTFARLHWASETQVELLSDNPHIPPITRDPAQFEVLGRVVLRISRVG